MHLLSSSTVAQNAAGAAGNCFVDHVPVERCNTFLVLDQNTAGFLQFSFGRCEGAFNTWKLRWMNGGLGVETQRGGSTSFVAQSYVVSDAEKW